MSLLPVCCECKEEIDIQSTPYLHCKACGSDYHTRCGNNISCPNCNFNPYDSAPDSITENDRQSTALI
ncbi:MAG: hypothetical protein ACXAE3_17130, partial [Candidatus Kariarchaeaceae archaeon]